MKLIDSNIIIRYLVEARENAKYSGIFVLFEKLISNEETVFLPELVLLEVFFVLTSFYKIPKRETAMTLVKLIELSGIKMNDKENIRKYLRLIASHNIDLVDAYLSNLANDPKFEGIYSNDKDLDKFDINRINL